MAVVLDEVVDEDYLPSPQEISEYAEWLGMDLDQDQDLFWIARDGLKAPLPAAWKPCQSGDGNVFYFNFETGESVWEHPCDEHYRRVYRRAKARRDAPVRVVSITGSCDTEDVSMMTVRCVGSVSGEEIMSMTIKPDMRVRIFRSMLAKHLDASKRRLKIMLLDGRLVSQDEDRRTMSALLGVECQVDSEKSTPNKEHKRLKKELKEKRVREYLVRCQVQPDDMVDPANPEETPEAPNAPEPHLWLQDPPEAERPQSQKCKPDISWLAVSDTLAAVAAAEAEASPARLIQDSGPETVKDVPVPCSSSSVSSSSPQEALLLAMNELPSPSARAASSSSPTALPALNSPGLRTSPVPEDSGQPELKSVFTQGSGHRTDIISRQRPQSLRLRPISAGSRHSESESQPEDQSSASTP